MLVFVETLEELSGKLETLLFDATSVFILTDENVSEKCLPELIAACPFLEKAEVIEIEPGESSKSHLISQHLWQHLLDCSADRKSVLINLGGGVVTDLGGFIASTYKRGIKTVHIPTSLLAMVDAAIGGKTGIDFDGYKNAIGTFYEADVLIYPLFIKTLPQVEIMSGFGEMLKSALIADPNFTSQLMALEKIGHEVLIDFIPTCAFIKQAIVHDDPFEKGKRKVLNLGHTVGHALESFWLKEGNSKPHGLCIAIGLLAETRIARRLNLCDPTFLEELDSFIIRIFELKQVVLPEFIDFKKYMEQDKKNEAGVIRLVLISNPGDVRIDVEVEPGEIEIAWKDLQKRLIA